MLESVNSTNKSRRTIAAINEAISNVDSKRFLESLIEETAVKTDVDFAFIGEVVPPENRSIKTKVFFANGVLADNFIYELEGTPCKEVIGRQLVSIEKDVCNVYPQDVLLKDMGICCYVGIPLLGLDGNAIGILGLLNKTPKEEILDEKAFLIAVSKLAQAELDRERLSNQLNSQQKLDRRLEAKRESLLAIAAHEIKTPVSCILGYAELLKDARPLMKQKEIAADKIIKYGKQLNAIIQDINLMDGEKADRLVSKVDPVKILDEALARCVESELPTKNVKINRDVSKNLIALWATDPCKLRLILKNLIENAIKYTESGEVWIKLWNEGDKLIFQVKDEGLGIPESELESIFHPFFRCKNHGDDKIGSGLGLSIVDKMLKAIDGEIEVESELKVGSIFTIRLPELKTITH